MKQIIFRPLRRVKKTGKIVVASYMQWRKVKTADYNEFSLIINDEYKQFPKDEYVFNHKEELLYFFSYNPADVMVFEKNVMDEERVDYDEMIKLYKDFIIHYYGGYGSPWTSYRMRGTDCDCVPTFSHWPEATVIRDDVWNYFGHDQFSVLTVETVVKWFGWFLYQLNNTHLKIGK